MTDGAGRLRSAGEAAGHAVCVRIVGHLHDQWHFHIHAMEDNDVPVTRG